MERPPLLDNPGSQVALQARQRQPLGLQQACHPYVLDNHQENFQYKVYQLPHLIWMDRFRLHGLAAQP